jgi:SAM-dependent methyltransferase
MSPWANCVISLTINGRGTLLSLEATLEAKSAWSLPSVLNYFQNQRQTTEQVYDSEYLFLKQILKEKMSVLDIGCAQGGFSKILGEHLSEFTYTGIDISQAMIEEAQRKYPEHQFLVCPEGLLPESLPQFDVVLCLGILHLNTKWREVIEEAWKKTRSALLLDLRETDGESLEDIGKSYFKMDFSGTSSEEARIPYNILNSGEALREVKNLCPGFSKLKHYGYLHPVSSSAVTPIPKVMMNTYLIERPM